MFTGFVMLILGVNNPMLLILPLWIFVALFQKKLSTLIRSFSLPIAFIGSGVAFGLLIEVFAILDNLQKPVAERILLSPDPLTDLFFGLFYYSFVVVTWYLLIRKISFSKADVFLLTGALGIATEQAGNIFWGIFAGPLGVITAAVVASIYGVFPYLAYLLTEDRFDFSCTPRKIWHYPLAIFALFIQWALFGLFVLPFLKSFSF